MSRSRWAIIIVVVCLVVTVAAVAYAAGQAKTAAPEVVRAQKFEVVDAGGRVRGELGMVEGGPALILYDEKGGKRAYLWFSPATQPQLTFIDWKGLPRAWLLLSPDGRPDLALFDGKGERTWSAP